MNTSPFTFLHFYLIVDRATGIDIAAGDRDSKVLPCQFSQPRLREFAR
jgi:hypothetical protein